MQSASCMRTFHVVRRLGLSLLASSSSSSQRSMTTAPLNVMQPAAAAAAAAADDRPPPLYQPEVLSLEEWSLRADSYLERAKELTGGRRSERQHPIYNFIYNYYAWKPSVLIDTWSPGSGVILQGGGSADGRLPMRYFERLADGSGGFYSASCLSAKRVKALRWVRNFLAASGSRAPHFNCFGLHEWAMLFHPPNGSGEVSRHQDLPLRVNMSQLNAVVESVPMACTHFDAFRFFSPEARPLNSKMLTRQDILQNEQGACVHANMDLFKWALKLHPLLPSELLADTLELAIEARIVDMRASPYDVSSYGFSPIEVENPEGRKEYQICQAELHRKSLPIRKSLLHHYDKVLLSAQPQRERIGEDGQ